MASLAVARSFLVAERPDFKDVDSDWLAELNLRLEQRGRGAKTALAKKLGVQQSQITKLCKGEQTPPGLVIRASSALGMALPRSWVDHNTYRIMEFGQKVNARIEEEKDPERRELIRGLANQILESMLGTGDTMLEHMEALLAESERRERKKLSN